MSMEINGTDGITWPDSSGTKSGKQSCKAWVNFNGTGTVAIRSSYNVSSITDNGTGDYDINFTVAMVDTNYAAAGACAVSGAALIARISLSKTTTVININTVTSAAADTDCSDISITIFGN